MSDRALRLPGSPLMRQAVGFLLVGGVGWLIDVGLFNALRATLLDPVDVAGGAVVAKAISTAVAIAVNWIGNRTVAFRGSTGWPLLGEALRFLAASLLGAAVSLVCLVVSHQLLGLTSTLADNLSANVVGLGLGTVLRFVLYRGWVFARRSA